MRFAALLDGVHGHTDVPTQTIVFVTGMGQAERRSTFAHELEQAAGHVDELVCGRNAARGLLPDVRRGGEALAWAQDLAEAADELWVDEPTLRAPAGGAAPVRAGVPPTAPCRRPVI